MSERRSGMARLVGGLHLLGLAALVAMFTSCGGGKYSLNIVTPPTTPNDGNTPALITITASSGGKPIASAAGGSVQLTTDSGQFSPYNGATMDTPSEQSTTQSLINSVGKFQMWSIHSGPTTVTANYTDTYGGAVTQTFTVTFGSGVNANPATVVWKSDTPMTIGLAGSGSITTSTVVFEVENASGGPVDDGVVVTFSINNATGGVTIAPQMATTSGGTGIVQTVVSSGTLPASVVVTATAVATSGSVTGMSDPITVGGGGVNGAHFSLSCPHRSIGGFQTFDLENTCTLTAGDVNGAFVPNTNIALLTEAGSVPPNVAIMGTNANTATFNYVTGCPYPIDVAPIAGEFSEEDAGFFNQCLPNPALVHRTVNPRDGRASLVAYVLGEQCYTDHQSSGHYDPGDYLASCDLGDPFLDENDNGKWDPSCANDPVNCDPAIPGGEPYVDAPGGDGGFHGPDGEWHGHTYIWASTTIVWTDSASRFGASASQTGTYTSLPAAGIDYPDVQCGEAETQFLTYADINGNIPAATNESDAVSLTATTAAIDAPSPVGLQGAAEQLNDFIALGKPLTQSQNAYNYTNVGMQWPGLLPVVSTSFANPATPCPPPTTLPAFNVQFTTTRTLSDGVTGSATQTESLTFPVASGFMTQ